MTRRSLLGSLAGALAAQGSTQRNVLFIAADDLNHAFSTYGEKLAPTPNLDRLARSGVRFDRAYCQLPLCSPSRTSLLTGLAPDATAVYDLQKHFRTTVPDVVTLPQLFQRNGYHAARVGKIYHYGNPGQIGADGLDDAPSWNHRVNPRGIDKDEEPQVTNYTPKRGLGSALAFYSSPARDEEHTDGKVALETIALMEQRRKEPWFLAAGFYRPHCPYITPSKYFDQVPLDKIKLVPFEEWEMQIAPQWAYFTKPANWGLDKRQRLEVMRAYYASILFLDANIGRLLDALERLRQAENTTIVFWPDHGYHLGEHGQWMKQMLFEPATRTPLIIAGAGVKAKAKACRRTVEFLDIYPTTAALAGIREMPAGLHGVNLGPLLDNPHTAWNRPAVSQVVRGKVTGYSIRTERHRYTHWNEGQEGEELYDYARDPRELKNLASADTPLKRDLRQQLDRIVTSRRPAVAGK
jgi:uncharacterized sulfatase